MDEREVELYVVVTRGRHHDWCESLEVKEPLIFLGMYGGTLVYVFYLALTRNVVRPHMHPYLLFIASAQI